MITIFLREHGTHNSGISIDFEADLDKYSDVNTLTEALFEYTRETIKDNEIPYYDMENMEEWLITDYEFEDDKFSFRIDEYSSLEALIKINESLQDLGKEELKLASSLIEEGMTVEDSIEAVGNDIYFFEGDMKEFAEFLVEEGNFGDIPENIASYIDFERMARDLEFSGNYTYNETNNIVFESIKD